MLLLLGILLLPGMRMVILVLLGIPFQMMPRMNDPVLIIILGIILRMLELVLLLVVLLLLEPVILPLQLMPIMMLGLPHLLWL